MRLAFCHSHFDVQFWVGAPDGPCFRDDDSRVDLSARLLGPRPGGLFWGTIVTRRPGVRVRNWYPDAALCTRSCKYVYMCVARPFG
jgi:hypothetical protein